MDKKGRRRTTLSDIDEQIEQLKAKRRHMVQQRAERFAKIAAQAGLAEVDISDDEALGVQILHPAQPVPSRAARG